MSAWDVAGAVVWTALAIFADAKIINLICEGLPSSTSLPFGFLTSLFSVYCIARLCGAHA